MNVDASSSLASPERRGWRPAGYLIACAAIAALILCAFWPVLSADFINFDDPPYVTDNPHVRQGLTLDGLRWAFTTAHTGYWHPLTWLSLMADASLTRHLPPSAPRALVYHVTNLLLHVVNALALFWLLTRLTSAPARAYLAALYFAVHPLRVESVAWVSERKDVLSAGLGLLCLIAYARYARAPSAMRYVLVLALLALSMLAKPMLVTLPCVMLLLDFWPLRRIPAPLGLPPLNDLPPAAPTRPITRLLIEKVPFFLIVIAVSIAAYKAQVAYGATRSTADYGPLQRIANTPVSYATYLGKTLWPTDLTIFYPLVTHRPLPLVLGCAAILLAITVAVLLLLRSRPHLAVGWFWFLGVLVPVIGIVQVGGQAMADRYTYFPTIGLLLMLFWSLPELSWLSPKRARLLLPLLAAPLLPLIVATRLQAERWHDSVSLFSHAVSITQDNYVAYQGLASGLSERGDFVQARKYFGLALQLRPGDPKVLTGLGAALVDGGQVAQGADLYLQALQNDPGDARTHNNLGVALARLGQGAKASEHFRRAVEINGEYVEARINLATQLIGQGQPGEAMEHLAVALRHQPSHAWAIYQQGRAFAGLKRLDDAIAAYRRSLAIQSRVAEVHNSLGVALAQSGRMAEALEQFQTAVALKPDYEDARHNLDRAAASLRPAPTP